MHELDLTRYGVEVNADSGVVITVTVQSETSPAILYEAHPYKAASEHLG